jgi:hypothetical protein
MASTYIDTSSDITDKLVKQFWDKTDARTGAWEARLDNEIEARAISLGVDIEDIKTTDINAKVKEYALAYLGMMVTFDNRYGNNNELIDDKYHRGWQDYQSEISRIGSQLTADMFTEEESSLDVEDTIGGNVIWRG